MLTGKWTPMNREVSKFNSLVNETKAMSEENDGDLMTRIEILYRAREKSDFKHKSAWNLKGNTSGTILKRQIQDETVIRLPTTNPSYLETTSGSSSQTREICDVYLTEKELHQLHLDEKALREILEEKAREEKAQEEKIKQKQADDEEFFLEFGVMRYNSDYELSD
ncbi:hypothetical protein Tco_1373057 [Tanacetum coccineum]